MAIKDFFKKLVPKVGKTEDEEIEEKETHICALCQKEDAEVKWMGQWWHKKCLRTAKKMAKKMI